MVMNLISDSKLKLPVSATLPTLKSKLKISAIVNKIFEFKIFSNCIMTAIGYICNMCRCLCLLYFTRLTFANLLYLQLLLAII